MRNEIFSVCREIAESAKKLGGRAFYVGGFVRDSILGLPNKDVDIEVYGLTVEQLRKLLEEIGEVDERKVGGKFGVFNLRRYDIDVSLPRSDAHGTSNRHTDFAVTFDGNMSYKKACSRRDFTINAIMKDVLTDEIVDPFHGVHDLERGLIRHVDSMSFVEDPLRVFRMAQFAARFDFTVSPQTIGLASEMNVSELSPERVAGELSKALLKADKPSIFFSRLRQVNHLEWFPEVKALIGVPQDPSHHPEGDVWTHTMMVLDEGAKHRSEATNPLWFMVACLCHDFGKPLTTDWSIIKQKWQAIGHDIEGVTPARNFVRRLFNNRRMEKYVANMVLEHQKPLLMVNQGSSKKRFMHLFDECVCPEDLFILCRCDNDGRGVKREFDIEMLEEYLEEYREIMSAPYINGDDLIGLGYKGRQIGEILDYVHKLRLAGVPKELVVGQVEGMFKAH